MKSILKTATLLLLLSLLGSCSVFKKSCDCPKFGKSELKEVPASPLPQMTLDEARAEK